MRNEPQLTETARPHAFPAFICWLRYFACRSAKATMVKVGLAAPGVVKTLPSENGGKYPAMKVTAVLSGRPILRRTATKKCRCGERPSGA